MIRPSLRRRPSPRETVPLSYAMMARDGIMARIQALPFFASFAKFSTNKSIAIQPQDLPFCGVYFIAETLGPDGNANHGEPRFKSLVRMGMSVIVQNNDGDAGEYMLDGAYQSIGTLFTDPTLYNNDDFQIEAYISGQRSFHHGTAGLDNAMPIAELRFELVLDLGVIDYPPYVPDIFERMVLTTAYRGKDPPEEQAARPQVVLETVFEQTRETSDAGMAEERRDEKTAAPPERRGLP